MPLDLGWYAVVRTCWMPRERQKADLDDNVNWEPQSEVIVAGTLKLEIHSTRALMQAVVEVSWMG